MMRSSRPLWPVCGPTPAQRNLADQGDDPLWPGDLGLCFGAGEGNRTLMTSLEGWGSAIELRPRGGRTRRSRAKPPAGSVPSRGARLVTVPGMAVTTARSTSNRAMLASSSRGSRPG